MSNLRQAMVLQMEDFNQESVLISKGVQDD